MGWIRDGAMRLVGERVAVDVLEPVADGLAGLVHRVLLGAVGLVVGLVLTAGLGLLMGEWFGSVGVGMLAAGVPWLGLLVWLAASKGRPLRRRFRRVVRGSVRRGLGGPGE